jgi:putative photosynthetic complex assembly protein
MHHRPDREMVPRVLVRAMFGLMIGATALVSYAQWADLPNVGVVTDKSVAREISVVLTGDRSGIYVASDTDGKQLALSSADKAGFIGVMGRVIDRERDLRGIASDAPVRIVQRDNGHYAIIDDTTGRSVELIGYGADNVAAFARLLD